MYFIINTYDFKILTGVDIKSKLKIDKTMLLNTLRQYEAWDTQKRQERIRNAGKKTPEQKWKEYLAIMEFGLSLKPYPSEHEQRQKIEMLNSYYEQITLFEQRRAKDGNRD